ncbi:MAG: DUF262 domain-containing protein [Opitutales bacterium]|nr:DUF262 domain-containing protein [Opitutales bacterium]
MRARNSKISAFLNGGKKRFVIPPFQRNYAWEKSQCNELWEDIAYALENRRTHYLGNIIYYKGPSSELQEYVLVDGQQRVTTVLLLLTAIRDFVKYDNKELSEKITKDYLLLDGDESSEKVKLKQTASDADSFKRIISGDLEEKAKDRTKYLLKNYKFFKSKLEAREYDVERIYKTIEKLEIVKIDLQVKNDDLRTIQTIFEKINSTGKKLEQSDLIRNLLLMTSSVEEQERLYKTYWIPLEDKYVDPENVSDFSKYFLMMKIQNQIKNTDVYMSFKRNYLEGQGIAKEDALKEMLKYARFYRCFKHEDCPEDKEISNLIWLHNKLDADALLPLYLYLFEKLFDSDREALKKIFDLILDFTIRFRVCEPEAKDVLPELVIALIKSFEGAEGAEPFDYYKHIRYEFSNSRTERTRFRYDEEFKKALKENPLPSNYALAILLKVEADVSGDGLRVSKRFYCSRLLPQKMTSEWIAYYKGKEEMEKVQEKYVDRIVNYALSEESKLDEKDSWAQKRKRLKHSSFKISKRLSEDEYKDWREDDIKRREGEIVGQICKAVSGPDPRKRELPSRPEVPETCIVLDDSKPHPHTKPKSFYFQDSEEEFECKSWNRLLVELGEFLSERDPEKFKEIVERNQIHKERSKKIEGRPDPIITTDRSLLTRDLEIPGTPYFVEANLSEKDARKYGAELCRAFDINPSSVMIEIRGAQD